MVIIITSKGELSVGIKQQQLEDLKLESHRWWCELITPKSLAGIKCFVNKPGKLEYHVGTYVHFFRKIISKYMFLSEFALIMLAGSTVYFKNLQIAIREIDARKDVMWRVVKTSHSFFIKQNDESYSDSA